MRPSDEEEDDRFINPPRPPGTFQRFSVIDAHLKRVEIKERHPEHPDLTPYALQILEQAEKEKAGKR